MIERAKIYSDGNHFIAIPKTAAPNKRRKHGDKKEHTEEEQRELDRRSLLVRKIRFIRKAYLNRFNYFATFTYDDKLHTEASFKKKLLSALSKLHTRRGWRYMGVWERGSKGRLHFHSLIYVPNGKMIGELFEKRDYDTRNKKMRLTIQNTYFNSRFGRSDFVNIDREIPILYNGVLRYLLKYITKTDERITYSRGLPTYLIADIAERDVVAEMGIWAQKLLLFDDAVLYDEGEILGQLDDEELLTTLIQQQTKT